MRQLTVLALLGSMLLIQPVMAEVIPLWVAKATIKRDSRSPNGAIARLILDAESGKRLAALVDEQSGKLATLVIEGWEIERQRISPALANGELSLNGIPLSKIGSTVFLLLQGRANLAIRTDSDMGER